MKSLRKSLLSALILLASISGCSTTTSEPEAPKIVISPFGLGVCEPITESNAMTWNELLLDQGHWIAEYKKCAERNEIKRRALIEFIGKK